MLYIKSRQSGEENINKISLSLRAVSLFLFVFSLSFVGCHKKTANPNSNLSIEDFSSWKSSKYSLNSHRIRSFLITICREDKDSTVTDFRTRSYYLNNGAFLWIDRHEVDSRADSLLSVLENVPEIGFTKASFDVKKIQDDLERVRNLDFDDSANSINLVMARLEYRMTKAYLKYVTGQRFGFVNPRYVFNRLDVLRTDSLGNPIGYRKLYDVAIQHPGKKFYKKALRKIYNDSVSQFMREVLPCDTLYNRYKALLQVRHLSNSRKMMILCNMERRRWRAILRPKDKYVIVNIPSFRLRAVDHDSVLEMNIGCGKNNTKTPLLSSVIYRMDVNPKWNVPMSIIQKDIASRHAGSKSYFDRNNMYVMYRKTGEKIPVERVTKSMLLSGDYRVIQNGGEGNSLGRIIFRFPNNFSVFLHDTSNRDVFDRSNRGVSHGCVRVEKPFDLAVFLLANKDSLLVDKLRISMDIPPQTPEGINLLNAGCKRPIGLLSVKPGVPVFITYFTMYPDKCGQMEIFPDVYGYDAILVRNIKPFLK